jgi:hypothetical protein
MTPVALIVLLLALLAAGAVVRGTLAEWRAYVTWSRASADALVRERDTAAAQAQPQRAEAFDRALADRREFHNAAVGEYNRRLGQFPAIVVARLLDFEPAETL